MLCQRARSMINAMSGNVAHGIGGIYEVRLISASCAESALTHRNGSGECWQELPSVAERIIRIPYYFS